MSILKRKVCCFMTLPRTLQETFFHYFSFSSIPSTFSSAFQLSSDSFFLFLVSFKSTSRQREIHALQFLWKILCFHHISCSCLLCMNINLDTIMTAAGHRNINFSHHLLLPFLTRCDDHKEFLHRIINCFYLLIYLIVLKNK